ncbi:MAG: NAD-dependent epimerase/dehydratase family protein [Dermatophilaceae bacterium]
MPVSSTRLLVLGGTAFLGRTVVRHAMAAGWDVTCLARGSAPVPAGARLVAADRDTDDALTAVMDEEWDAVVDVSRQPVQVRRAVRDLRTRHWVFVSTANVYARFDRREQGETSPLLAPLPADAMADMSEYGPAKVACEQAVRSSGVTSTIVRCGLIGGPGDASGRSGYYVWRTAHPTGPDLLVPPDLDFPCALIDVDDLAAWIVLAAGERIDGAFNATGPTITLGDLIETGRRAVGDRAPTGRPVPAEVLEREGVAQWMGPRSLPLWISDPDWRWFATLDTSAARAQGLRTRPLEETLRRALAYEETRTEPRGTGLTDEEEVALRAALEGVGRGD